MIARRFEELIVWQLAYRLEQEVFAFTNGEPAKRDFKYCNQIRESSRSAVRNISEGFGRYSPRDFRSFLRIASGSLHETKNQLIEGLNRRYLSPSDHDRLKRLCLRAIKANNRLMAYLATAKAPEAFAGNPKTPEPPEP